MDENLNNKFAERDDQGIDHKQTLENMIGNLLKSKSENVVQQDLKHLFLNNLLPYQNSYREQSYR